MSGWTSSQQLALAWVPKFSSIFSILGSGWIAIEVLTDRGSDVPKRKHPYHRLLLGMSVYDILESFWNFLSTWPIPKGTEGVWDPRGTTATCTAQGFFLTLSVAVPIYNAFLSLYYLLVIYYGISDTVLKKRVEPAMHIVAFVWAFGTALVSAWMGLLNNANLWCWIAPYPSDCKDSRRFGDEANCERGDNAWIYRWAFYFAPLWFCICFAIVCTLMVYTKVYRYDQISLQYRKPDRVSFVGARLSDAPHRRERDSYYGGRYSRHMVSAARGFHKDDSSSDSSQDNFQPSPSLLFDGLQQIEEEEETESGEPEEDSASSAPAKRRSSSIMSSLKGWQARRSAFAEDNPRTVEVFRQALWYLLTFIITHVWSTSNRIVQQSRDGGETYFGVILVHSFFDPLQGFLNFLVYQRPRYLRARKDMPDESVWSVIVQTMRFSYFPPPGETTTTTVTHKSSAANAFASQDQSDDNFFSGAQAGRERMGPSNDEGVSDSSDNSSSEFRQAQDDGPLDERSSALDQNEAPVDDRSSELSADVVASDDRPDCTQDGSNPDDSADTARAVVQGPRVEPETSAETSSDLQEKHGNDPREMSAVGDGSSHIKTAVDPRDDDEVDEHTIVFARVDENLASAEADAEGVAASEVPKTSVLSHDDMTEEKKETGTSEESSVG